MTSPHRGVIARVATAPVVAAALTASLLTFAPSAHADDASAEAAAQQAFAHDRTAQQTAARKAKKRAAKRTVVLRVSRAGAALKAATTRRGARYVYGGTGPWTFDCSGLTRWAYQRVGKNLPRTSGAQVGATRRISRSQARAGDLVFFQNGGRVYHVGLYAGGNQIFHASRPGTPVGTGPIWTSSVFFGRVR